MGTAFLIAERSSSVASVEQQSPAENGTTLRRLAAGVAVLLVEQRVDAVLSIADRVAFIENGHNLETLDAAAIRADHGIVERHLGV